MQNLCAFTCCIRIRAYLRSFMRIRVDMRTVCKHARSAREDICACFYTHWSITVDSVTAMLHPVRLSPYMVMKEIHVNSLQGYKCTFHSDKPNLSVHKGKVVQRFCRKTRFGTGTKTRVSSSSTGNTLQP